MVVGLCSQPHNRPVDCMETMTKASVSRNALPYGLIRGCLRNRGSEDTAFTVFEVVPVLSQPKWYSL